MNDFSHLTNMSPVYRNEQTRVPVLPPSRTDGRDENEERERRKKVNYTNNSRSSQKISLTLLVNKHSKSIFKLSFNKGLVGIDLADFVLLIRS